ncbi:MAG: hypothetical protein JSV88_06570 [Candidatus Aminicenantes bacterium]|nr:MAG: hypothetical protein JSV88_06570 [Candidatus Aminicenantes bacterium]
MKQIKKNHDTKSISKIGEKGTKLLYISIISLTVIVIAIVYFLLPGILGEKKGGSPIIRQMRQLTLEVGKLETELKYKENELNNLVKKYHEQTGEKLPELGALGLPRKQRKLSEVKMKNQEDVSIEELLNEILAKKSEISRIEETIKKYEALLPRPHIVIEGQNHYQIAADFLVNEKGIEKEKAIWLVERTALFDELMQGFRVWNFYSGDEYGTFVTQGDAPISPNELSRKAKKELITERDKAVSEKQSLAADIKVLEKTRNNLRSEVKNLRKEKEKQKRQLNDLLTQNEKMKEEIQRLINSLYYLVDLEKNLKKEGILKNVFLGSPKLKEISSKYFDHTIDLRATNTIEIFAQQFGLSEIDKVTLYPRFYKRDIDYIVTMVENKQKAVVTILALEKFKTERVVISVK